MGHKIEPERKEQVAELINSGATVKEIHQKTGAANQTISNIRKELNGESPEGERLKKIARNVEKKNRNQNRNSDIIERLEYLRQEHLKKAEHLEHAIEALK